MQDTIFWAAAGIVIPCAVGSLACVVLFLAKLRIPINGPVADIVLLLPATGSLDNPDVNSALVEISPRDPYRNEEIGG